MVARLFCRRESKKSYKALTFVALLCLTLFAAIASGSDGPKPPKASAEAAKDTLASAGHREDSLSYFDSLLVIHFHPTVQCSCCINVGIFSKKGLEKYFAREYKAGQIVFKEYDIDEDTLTAKKYQIFWSALGFEKFSKGKSLFREIESVWEFCEQEKKFLPDFKKELVRFISQSPEEKAKEKPPSEEGK